MWTAGPRCSRDGQYYGEHQWFNIPDCTLQVAQGPHGLARADPAGRREVPARVLRPSRRRRNPADDRRRTARATNDEQGCNDSDLVSPLPQNKPAITTIATLPSRAEAVPEQALVPHPPQGAARRRAPVGARLRQQQARRPGAHRRPPHRAGRPAQPAARALHGEDHREDRARQDDHRHAPVPHLRAASAAAATAARSEPRRRECALSHKL